MDVAPGETEPVVARRYTTPSDMYSITDGPISTGAMRSRSTSRNYLLRAARSRRWSASPWPAACAMARRSWGRRIIIHRLTRGKGAAIGAGVGAAAGFLGGTFTGNKQVEIPVESALSFTLAQPLTLPPAGK